MRYALLRYLDIKMCVGNKGLHCLLSMFPQNMPLFFLKILRNIYYIDYDDMYGVAQY